MGLPCVAAADTSAFLMSKIEVFGVIGAGQMGRGIAQVAASSGFQVRLLDASEELAKCASD